MSIDDTVLLSFLIFAAGFLYSSVGHAGASGYLAAMALFGLAPDVMKPAALILNILVAVIATFQFYRSGYFSWVSSCRSLPARFRLRLSAAVYLSQVTSISKFSV